MTRTPPGVSMAVAGVISHSLNLRRGQTVSRNRRITGIVTGWKVLLVMALVGVVQLGRATSRGAELRHCYRVSLQEPPSWISSATWIEDSSRLLVVDPYRNEFISYGPDGRFVGLDGQFRAVRENALVWKSAASKRVGSLYQWKVAGDELVAFGTLARPDLGFDRGLSAHQAGRTAGIYAQDGMLYLLTRRPGGKAKTAWWLFQIVPKKDVSLGRGQLTTVNHLTVMPGERSWYIFENGQVEPFQPQKVPYSMLVHGTEELG